MSYENTSLDTALSNWSNAAFHMYNGTHENAEIYNNTVDFDQYTTLRPQACLSFLRVKDIKAKNNILTGCTNALNVDSCTGTIEVDYNLYYNVGTRWINGWPSYPSSDCRSRAACRLTPFFQENATITDADPNFTTDPDGTENSGDWTLTALSTAAIGTGVNLGADCTGCANDIIGAVRGDVWDIGAYEYGGSDVTAPTAVSSAVASDGETLTITWSETVVATASTGFTITPSGGAATLSHVSTSGNTSTFTISRIILYGETAVIGYTQPGDGIEDPTGNDVVIFSDFPVTNNSTQIDSPERTLTVTMTGGGRATSSPAGIDCGATCVYDFSNGATVTLSGQCHNGWQNATITGDCNAGGAVVMSADSACTVTCYEIPVSPWVQ
jgi:hypothetical protein